MCLQYREGEFSLKPCDSTLNPNRQNIGLDTEPNSNWDSPELFPSVYVIASDDEGITPLTIAAVLLLVTPVRLSLSITVSLCPRKNRYLPLMMMVDTFDYTVFFHFLSENKISHISVILCKNKNSCDDFWVQCPVLIPTIMQQKATPPQGQDS